MQGGREILHALSHMEGRLLFPTKPAESVGLLIPSHTHTQMGNFSHPLCLKWARLLSQGIWLPVITREGGGGPISERGRISIYQENRQGMALAYIRHR